MDKFPKMETIEATLYGQRIDGESGASELAVKLRKNCPEFMSASLASLQTICQMASGGQEVAEITMAVVLTRMLQVGVTAERARAECEQLTAAAGTGMGDTTYDHGEAT